MNELLSQSQLEMLESAKRIYWDVRSLWTRESLGEQGEYLTDEQYLEKLDQMIAATPAIQSRIAKMERPASVEDITNGLNMILAGKQRALRSVKGGSADEMLRAVWGRMFSEEIMLLRPSAAAVAEACRVLYLDNDRWAADKLPNISEVVAAVKEAQHIFSAPLRMLPDLPEIRDRVKARIEDRARRERLKAEREAKRETGS